MQYLEYAVGPNLSSSTVHHKQESIGQQMWFGCTVANKQKTMESMSTQKRKDLEIQRNEIINFTHGRGPRISKASSVDSTSSHNRTQEEKNAKNRY